MDAAVIFDEDTPLVVVGALMPNVMVEADDHREMRPASGTAVIPLTPGQSTTGIIAKLRGHHG